jgi:sugar phosphate isomerase/epimerase
MTAWAKPSRRTFLVLGAGAAAACTSIGSASPRAIGLQTYMLGEEAIKDFAGSMRAIAAIGYREVETGVSEARTAEEIRRVLDANGLRCPSLHVALKSSTPGDLTLENPVAAAKAAHIVGASYVTVPMFTFPAPPVLNPGESLDDGIARLFGMMTPAYWSQLASTLNEKGALLKRDGLKLAYHNHNAEFSAVGTGVAMDVLFSETDPELVWFEADLGWVAAGGADPAEFLRLHGHRVRLAHVKDLKATAPNTLGKMTPSDLGAGVIDWERTLSAAKAAGIEHYFVEQEPPFTRSRLEAAQIAYDFLQNRL